MAQQADCTCLLRTEQEAVIAKKASRLDHERALGALLASLVTLEGARRLSAAEALTMALARRTAASFRDEQVDRKAVESYAAQAVADAPANSRLLWYALYTLASIQAIVNPSAAAATYVRLERASGGPPESHVEVLLLLAGSLSDPKAEYEALAEASREAESYQGEFAPLWKLVAPCKLVSSVASTPHPLEVLQAASACASRMGQDGFDERLASLVLPILEHRAPGHLPDSHLAVRFPTPLFAQIALSAGAAAEARFAFTAARNAYELAASLGQGAVQTQARVRLAALDSNVQALAGTEAWLTPRILRLLGRCREQHFFAPAGRWRLSFREAQTTVVSGPEVDVHVKQCIEESCALYMEQLGALTVLVDLQLR
jgi:hypothetical protein